MLMRLWRREASLFRQARVIFAWSTKKRGTGASGPTAGVPALAATVAAVPTGLELRPALLSGTGLVTGKRRAAALRWAWASGAAPLDPGHEDWCADRRR